MKHYYQVIKNLNLLFLLSCFILNSTSVQAQNQSISGKVTDAENSEGIPGVTIQIKGTTSGAITDVDGNYTISGVAAADVLIFSFVGMIPQEISVGDRTVIDVTMELNVEDLEEVVVVGYGTQKRATLSTAISSIGSEEIGEVPVANLGQALQGRTSGVIVTNNGSPGGDPLIRIRGLSTFGDGNPLVVLDGVFLDVSDLKNLNPDNVEKVDILKDAASTAIYGSRGSNGVIIITTKKGSPGKAKFSVNAYTGVQYSNERYDVMNTEQYIQFLREIVAQEDDGIPSDRVPEVLSDPSFDGNGVNTNWQDELFQQANMTNVDFNVSGGGDGGTYSLGFSAFDQEGIYIDTNFKRYTFNAASEIKVVDRLKIGQNLSAASSRQVSPVVWGGREILYNAVALPPYIPVVNEEGIFGGSSNEDGNDAINIVRVTDTEDNLNNFNSLYGNVFAELEPVNGLTLRSQYGINASANIYNQISRAYQTTGRDSQADTRLVKNRRIAVSNIWTHSLTYDTGFGNHNFRVTLVNEVQETEANVSNSFSSTEVTSVIEEIQGGQITTSSFPGKLISYLGRLNYDYDERFLLQLSIRRDKSSVFGGNSQVGWFPAASVGWIASNEAFLEGTMVSNFKLSASYGETGNNRINGESTEGFNRFISALSLNYFYPIGGETQQGAFISGTNNPNLKWETGIKRNFGLDLGLLDDKITLSADYFFNDSRDLLIDDRVAPSLGVSDGFQAINIGDIDVEGYELNLGYAKTKGDFKWSVNVNLSSFDQTVNRLGVNTDQELTGLLNPPFSETFARLAPGEPLYHFFGYIMDGVYSTDQEVIDHLGEASLATNPDASAGITFQAGDVRFRDISGPDGVPDGLITADDRTVIGDPNPDFIYGLNLNASYKGFDFSVLLTGVQGVDVLNANGWWLQSQEAIANYSTDVLRRWQQPGDVTDVPRFRFEGSNINNAISTRYIEDGSFARIRNLTIGYSLPKSLVDRYFNGAVSNVRVYGQSLNLLTITKYSGFNPEVEPLYGATSGNIQALNVDRGRQPQPVTFLAGIQIDF